MTKELAKTLTTALVQFIDEQRPEGSMCCSNTDCENIRAAFEEGEYDCVEAFIQKKLSRLTEFEKVVGLVFTDAQLIPIHDSDEFIKKRAAELLALAKKELIKEWNENMKDEYARGKKDGLTIGYNNGYKDAEKQYNESVVYHYSEPVPTGVAYKSPQCYTDVMVAPNINSGTSTAKAEG